MALGDSLLGPLGAMPDWEQINQGMANNDIVWDYARQHGLLNNAAHAQSLQAMQDAAMAQAAYQGTNAQLTQATQRATMASRAREMFLKRMGGLRAEMKVADTDFLQCHVYQDMVYLFYCFGGRDGCVKEGIDLFPSDQLITQFRLVLIAPE